MTKKPSVGIAVGLLLSAGFVLGITTLPGSDGLHGPALESMPPAGAATESLAWQVSDTAFHEIEDDPRTRLYEPFVGCSADYANGPGADLDRKKMLGPDNSVMVSPHELKALGMSEAVVRAQAREWNKLTAAEREEQLCRAAQQNADIDELR